MLHIEHPPLLCQDKEEALAKLILPSRYHLRKWRQKYMVRPRAQGQVIDVTSTASDGNIDELAEYLYHVWRIRWEAEPGVGQ